MFARPPHLRNFWPKESPPRAQRRHPASANKNSPNCHLGPPKRHHRARTHPNRRRRTVRHVSDDAQPALRAEPAQFLAVTQARVYSAQPHFCNRPSPAVHGPSSAAKFGRHRVFTKLVGYPHFGLQRSPSRRARSSGRNAHFSISAYTRARGTAAAALGRSTTYSYREVAFVSTLRAQKVTDLRDFV